MGISRRRLLLALTGICGGALLANMRLFRHGGDSRQRRPVIISLSGAKLRSRHRDLILALRPSGFILHKGNIITHQQLSDLTASFYDLCGPNVLIITDQEGGPISRLETPEWQAYPAESELGMIAEKNYADGARATYLSYRLMAHDLLECGVNTNAAPVLDVSHPGYETDTYNKRSFSSDPTRIIALGKIACDATLEGGVLPVIKHMPGQGAAKADVENMPSHIDLPLEALDKEFEVFRAFKDMPLGMASAVIIDKLDSRPVCFSAAGVGLIRSSLNFSGLLMSDDLDMRFNRFTFREKNQVARDAGIDLLVHSYPVDHWFRKASRIQAWPEYDATIGLRVASALALAKRSYKPCDVEACRKELAMLMMRYDVHPAPVS